MRDIDPQISENLVSLSEYKAARFPGRKPCLRTLRNWIKLGKLPGQKVGAHYFVRIPRDKPREHDPLIDRMIEGS